MKKTLFFCLWIIVGTLWSWNYDTYSQITGPGALLFNPAGLQYSGRSSSLLLFNMQDGFKTFGYYSGRGFPAFGISYDDDERFMLSFGTNFMLNKIGLGYSYHYDVSKVSKHWWSSGGVFFKHKWLNTGITMIWGDKRDFVLSLTLKPLWNAVNLSFDWRIDYFNGFDLLKNYDVLASVSISPFKGVTVFAQYHNIENVSWEIRGGLNLSSKKGYLTVDYLDQDNFRVALENKIFSYDSGFVRSKTVYKVNISGSYTNEIPQREGFFEIFPMQRRKSFLKLIMEINEIIDNKNTHGFYIVLDSNNDLSLAQLWELRQLMQKFKKNNPSGKIITYLPTSFSIGSYLFASVSDTIVMEKGASVTLRGIGGEIQFYRELFNKLGIEAEFFRPEDCVYKAAAEQFTETEASGPFRENLLEVFNDIYEMMVNEIKGSRGIDIDEISKDNFLLDSSKAEQLGLVDKVMHPVNAEKLFTGRIRIVDLENIYRERQMVIGKSIGVVSLSGSIVDHATSGIFGSGDNINPASFDRIRSSIRSSKIKDFILIINSGGGSGSASDLIYEMIEDLRSTGKRIYVYNYDVAGSGGYYISCNAEKIFASPFVITGSIGVIGGKFSLGDLYKKIGLNTESIGVGHNYDFFSTSKTFTESEKAQFIEYLTDFYDLFIKRISKGRNLDYDHIKKHAKGRIYTGNRAKEIELIDETGTFYDLVDHIAEQNNWKGKVNIRYINPARRGSSQLFKIETAYRDLMVMKPFTALLLMEPKIRLTDK